MTSPTEAETMTAIAIEGGKGPASALKPERLPIPEPGPGQILIQVKAAGVNRPDIAQRMGAYPPPPGAPSTLGLEVAGVVAKAAGRWKVGDKVTARLGGGGYAEYAVVDARHALPIPAGLDFEQAAGLPETVFTVFANVFEHGGAALGAWFMTLFIQRAAHRDTQAIQAKLDELLRAHGDARTEMANLDADEPEEIERLREREQARA
jgi:D-arabinose 1-dehydrogenase-like Zn-dependent alcohol dehydrogenase